LDEIASVVGMSVAERVGCGLRFEFELGFGGVFVSVEWLTVVEWSMQLSLVGMRDVGSTAEVGIRTWDTFQVRVLFGV
jgi:hypothetical protein